MKKSFWLARILESSLISIPLIWLVSQFFNKTLDYDLNTLLFLILVRGMFFVIICICSIITLNIVTKICNFSNMVLPTNMLRKLTNDFHILFILSFLFTGLFVIYFFIKLIFLGLFLGAIENFPHILLVFLKDATTWNFLVLFASLGILSIGFLTVSFFLLGVSWLITGIFLFFYVKEQVYHKIYRKDFATMSAFYSLQFSKIVARTSWFTIGISSLIFVPSFIITLVSIFDSLIKSRLYNLFDILSFVFLTILLYLLISTLLLLAIMMSPRIPYIVEFLIVSLTRNSDIKYSIHKSFSSFAYSYISTISKIIIYIFPYSLFSVFTDSLYFSVLRQLLHHSSQISFIPNSFELRGFTSNFIKRYKFSSLSIRIMFLNSKETYLESKLELASMFATQASLIGDLKLAESIYKEIKNDLLSLEIGKSLIFTQTVNYLCDYYLKTSQHDYLLSLWREIAASEKSNDYFFKLSYLTSWMKLSFASGEYSNKAYSELSAKIFKNENSLDILSEILCLDEESKKNRYSPSYFINKIKSPQDLFFFYLEFTTNTGIATLIAELFNSNNSIWEEATLLGLSEFIRYIFDSQNKIYLSLSNNENIYPEDVENIRSLQKFYSYDFLGTNLSFLNPFLSENLKLIPLILTTRKYSSSLDVFNLLVQEASFQARYTELAFLKCCKGRFLVSEGNIDEGISFLEEGLSLYEGIRHSINSDQLGIGIGSSYLQYYDWLIEALIQKGDFEQIFNYVERASGRALLDLVSGKTSYSVAKTSTKATQQIISKIQSIELNIFFSQQEFYKPLTSFTSFFSSSFKKNLERDFYKSKNKKLESLLQERKKLEKELNDLDPVAATLIGLKSITYNLEDQNAAISIRDLFQNRSIAENEVVLCFHILYNSELSVENRDWDKVIGFALYLHNDTLHLRHHIVDNRDTVTSLQESCKEIILEVDREQRSQRNKLISGISTISSNLIEPLLRDLPDSHNSILVSAQGELQFMPWCLLSEDINQDTCLVEKYQIRLTPNLTLLYLLKQREEIRYKKQNYSILVAGIEQYPKLSDHLFWSGVEINNIGQVYFPEAKILKDKEVDLLFRKEFSQVDLIHYSGHAGYRKSNLRVNSLDNVYLCLQEETISASQILDGVLENPNAKTMILSACLTGQGDLTVSGSEVLGLERALFHAGLSSMVTTLWSVTEFSTAIFMIKFHRLWHSKSNTLTTLAYTLAETQLWLKQVSWAQLKREFPTIEQDVRMCINTYEILIQSARQQNDELAVDKFNRIQRYYETFVLPYLESESPKLPFEKAYYWAAFQVSGVS